MNVGELKRYLAEHEFDDDAPVLLRIELGARRLATAGRRPGDGGLVLSVDMGAQALELDSNGRVRGGAIGGRSDG